MIVMMIMAVMAMADRPVKACVPNSHDAVQ